MQSFGLRAMLGKPVKALVKSVTSLGYSWLNEPSSASDGVETQLVSQLWDSHGTWQILLIGEYEKDGILELILSEHLVELFFGYLDSLPIVGVDDVDESLGIVIVVSPEESDLILTTYVPHIKADVLVLNCLDVEANSWDRCHHLAKLQLVQDCGLTCCIETNHQNAHLLLAKHALPNLAHQEAHGCNCEV